MKLINSAAAPDSQIPSTCHRPRRKLVPTFSFCFSLQRSSAPELSRSAGARFRTATTEPYKLYLVSSLFQNPIATRHLEVKKFWAPLASLRVPVAHEGTVGCCFYARIFRSRCRFAVLHSLLNSKFV